MKTTIKERPILFSAPMVRAILTGTKTQTRRIIKTAGAPVSGACWDHAGYAARVGEDGRVAWWNRTNGLAVLGAPDPLCPYGVRGAGIYVKESAWMWCEKMPDGLTKTGRAKFRYRPLPRILPIYCADHPARPSPLASPPSSKYECVWKHKLGRYLPRLASRINLSITAVRVERLQDISEADAIAEGIKPITWLATGEKGWKNYTPALEGAGFNRDAAMCTSPRRSYETLWESINGPDSWAANPWVWVIEFQKV